MDPRPQTHARHAKGRPTRRVGRALEKAPRRFATGALTPASAPSPFALHCPPMPPGVVITGLGPITAFGTGIDPLWDAMCEGKSAIARLTAFDASGFACHVGAELPADAFSVRQVVPKSYRKSTKVMCRDIELAVGAAAIAVQHAGLVTKGVDPDQPPTIPGERVGCQIGAGLIAAEVHELGMALAPCKKDDGTFDMHRWGELGMQDLTPLWLLKYLPNMLACHVTIVHGCQGPSNTITCCEASSALSLGESMRVIERGAADACLTGGVESRLNPMAFARQLLAGRLADSPDDVDPATLARPFDPNATGTVLGEGGGILVVESGESAARRGATPIAAVTGFATTQSFCPDTVGLRIETDDASLRDVIEIALANAKVSPDDVDAIVPLGSSIPATDAAESAAIRACLGDRAAKVPIVTTVPFVGNCSAGNGGVALCVAARCVETQRLPARLNTSGADGLDADARPAVDTKLDTVLVMTTSQGGQNAAVVLRKP